MTPEQPKLIDLSSVASQPDNYPQAGTLRRMVAWETIKSRGIREGLRQYGKFFASMIMVYGLVEPERSHLIQSAYFWFRHVDDIADGDRHLPVRYNNALDYLSAKRLVMGRLFDDAAPVWGEKEDLLLVDYYQRSRRLGISLTRESLAILDSMIFDVERSKNRRVPTQQELDNYYQGLDFATVEGALKVAGESCSSDNLSDLSWAVRIMYNLRDFPKDFSQGLINISIEEVSSYGLDLGQIRGKSTIEEMLTYSPMRRWYRDQQEMGCNYLDRAKSTIDDLSLKWVTRFGLQQHFIKPSQAFFNQVGFMVGEL